MRCKRPLPDPPPLKREPAPSPHTDAALYEQGEAAARKLMDMSHMRKEIDDELARSFAEQQQNSRK